MEIEISSPAKINLSLAVTGLRADGFHGLTSLVAPLAFGDRVSLTVEAGKEGISLKSSDPHLPIDDQNIAWRAAERFLRHFGFEARVDIRIEKSIPIGAGLGGGSSNAASVLKGLAALLDIRDDSVLEVIAGELGSDCPLFLKSEPLIMRGRGEEIERLGETSRRSLLGQSIVLFKPSFGISTAWAYQSLAGLGAYADQVETENRLEAWKNRKLPLGNLLMNSFDPVVGNKFPSIPLLLKLIREKTGSPCLMSGSGSCCFALCDPDAENHIRELVAEFWGERAFFRSTRILDIGLTATEGFSF